MIIKVENFIPTQFYPYPHVVTSRIVDVDMAFGRDEVGADEVEAAWNYVVRIAEKANIGYRNDNKIAFKLVDRHDETKVLYIGRKDHKISIGLDVRDMN